MKQGQEIQKDRADGKRATGSTYMSMEYEQRKKYKADFIAENKDLLYPKLSSEEIAQVREYMEISQAKEEEPVTEDDRSLRYILKDLIDITKKLLFMESKDKARGKGARVKKTRSAFGLGERAPMVDYDIECLMRVIYGIEARGDPDLFRKSASLQEVKCLMEKLTKLREELQLEEESVSKEQAAEERAAGEDRLLESPTLRHLSEGLGEFENHAISSVFKLVLRSKGPLFPAEHMELYLAMGNEQDAGTLLLMSRLISIFLVDREQRDKLEAVSCFFHSLLEREETKLCYKNVCIVMVPSYFLDDSFMDNSHMKELDFKFKVDKLVRFLGFFLLNCRQIFVLDGPAGPCPNQDFATK